VQNRNLRTGRVERAKFTSFPRFAEKDAGKSKYPDIRVSEIFSERYAFPKCAYLFAPNYNKTSKTALTA
jgi:hypothetical protein